MGPFQIVCLSKNKHIQEFHQILANDNFSQVYCFYLSEDMLAHLANFVVDLILIDSSQKGKIQFSSEHKDYPVFFIDFIGKNMTSTGELNERSVSFTYPFDENMIKILLENLILHRRYEMQSQILNTIIDNTSTPMLVIDPSNYGKIINCNLAAQDYYRYSRETFLSLDISHIDLHNELLNKLDRKVLNSGVQTISSVHLDSEGSLKQVELLIARDANSYSENIYISINDRVKNSHKLVDRLEIETRYRDLFNSMLSAFALHEILLDQDGNPYDYQFLEVNPAFEKMIGRKAVEVVGKTVLTLWPKTEPYWIERYARVALSGCPTEFEDYSISFDKTFQVYAFSPKERQFAVLFLDITENKKQKERIIQDRLLFEELTENINEIFWVREVKSQQFSFVSTSYEKIWGKSVNSIMEDSNSLYDVIVNEDRLMVINAHEELFNNQIPFDIEYRIRRENQIVWIRSRGFPVYSINNKVGKFVGIAEDISHQKLVQEKYEKTIEMHKNHFEILHQITEISTRDEISEELFNNLLISMGSLLKPQSILLVIEDNEFLDDRLIFSYPKKLVHVLKISEEIQKLRNQLFQISEMKIINGEDIDLLPFLADDIILVSPIQYLGQYYGGLMIGFSPERVIHQEMKDFVENVTKQLALISENRYLIKRVESNAVIDERQRISRDLHDSVTQSLYSLNLITKAGLDRLDAGNFEEVEECLLEIQKNALQSLQEMRLLLFELHPPILENLGIVEAINYRLNSVERKTGFIAEFHSKIEAPLEKNVQTELYRMTCEGLNNIIKHAKAKNISIHLLCGCNERKLVIQDDGVGFIPGSSEGKGFGLEIIKARAKKINATVNITTAPGIGTKIEVVCTESK
jgi:PAS domain S-box-containing protein